MYDVGHIVAPTWTVARSCPPSTTHRGPCTGQQMSPLQKDQRAISLWRQPELESHWQPHIYLQLIRRGGRNSLARLGLERRMNTSLVQVENWHGRRLAYRNCIWVCYRHSLNVDKSIFGILTNIIQLPSYLPFWCVSSLPTKLLSRTSICNITSVCSYRSTDSSSTVRLDNANNCLKYPWLTVLAFNTVGICTMI